MFDRNCDFDGFRVRERGEPIWTRTEEQFGSPPNYAINKYRLPQVSRGRVSIVGGKEITSPKKEDIVVHGEFKWHLRWTRISHLIVMSMEGSPTVDGRNPAPPKNPGMMIHLPTNNGFPWLQSGANGFRPSTVWANP